MAQQLGFWTSTAVARVQSLVRKLRSEPHGVGGKKKKERKENVFRFIFKDIGIA